VDSWRRAQAGFGPLSVTPTTSVPEEQPSLVVRLDRFDKRIGLKRQKALWFEAVWYLVKCAFFLSPLPWPSSWKRRLLLLFGAKVGIGFVLRPRVNIHMPWKLVVGDHCWIGEDCEFLNLEPIVIHNHVAIAHRVYLATGNHDFTDHTMPYRNQPITIESGSWVASCAFIGPGVTIGQHSVVAAGSVVTRSVPRWSVVQGNPAQVVRKRVLRR
jgi:putative colanic acid biosynthesis acetyltransferase WcaF